MCGAHAAVRTLLGELVEKNERATVVDMEAGLEHLSRGTVRHSDCLLLILEPYYKSMETGARMNALGQELGIPHVLAVANKIRDSEESSALRSFCQRRGVKLLAEVPFDDGLLKADREGVAPLDSAPDGLAVAAISRLAQEMRSLF